MSDQETTDNFFQAWTQWDRTEPPAVFFRLYYNDSGDPLFYSMEDLPGKYIEIDQPTYELQSYNVKVLDGKLQKVERSKNISRLKPADDGVSCQPNDICVVVQQNSPNIKWKKSL